MGDYYLQFDVIKIENWRVIKKILKIIIYFDKIFFFQKKFI